MNELQIFENQTFGQVRTLIRDGEPWFVDADVCRALDLDKTWNALQRLDDDEKGTTSISTLGGDQGMSIVNEPGLYALVLGSRKAEARAFKRWITHEVIPAIRKHGGYLTPSKIEEALLNPDTIISLATQLKEERAERLRLADKVQSDAPKVMFAEAVSAADGAILVAELSRYQKQNGVNTGQNRLYETLRADGYLCSAQGERWNMPTQKSMELKLFEIKKNMIMTTDGPKEVKPTVKVTGKGQIYFLNRYRKIAN